MSGARDTKALTAEVLEIVRRAGRRGITEECLDAVLAIRGEVRTLQAMETLIIRGELVAHYTGGPDGDRFDSSNYEYRTPDFDAPEAA